MKCKCLLTAGCILLLACNAMDAQDTHHKANHGKIGIIFSSLGSNGVDMDDYICDCGYNMKGFYNIGITYIYPIKHWLGIETGLEYSRQMLQTDSFGPHHYSVSRRDFTLLDIPLTVRLNFLRFFFANSGFLIAVDPNKRDPIGKQTGIGEMAGIGARYKFKIGISLFVNPYMKFYSNILHKSQYGHHQLDEAGFRFGITYNL